MSREFIKIEEGELEDGGALLEGVEVAELQGDERLPVEDFKALWGALQGLETGEALERIAEQFADEPWVRQEVLTTWLAQELGYSRVFRRRTTLTREFLWDLLNGKKYGELTKEAEEALAMIGRSLRPARSYLHPSVALATLAIWRHSEDEGLRREAEERLRERALPDEPEWLFEVVGALAEEGRVMPHERSVERLVELALESSFWEVAAILSAMVLVHRHGRWFHSAVVSNMEHACDVASQEYPQESAAWLFSMAKAAVWGQLRFSWLERPVHAAIRMCMSFNDREWEGEFRQYAARRPFEAEPGRLEELYREDLKRVSKGEEEGRQRLLAEVKATEKSNPTRAMRLMELVVLRGVGRRGSRPAQLRGLVEALSLREELEEGDEWLVGLYVQNMTLEAHAVEVVRRVGRRVRWEENEFASQEDFDLYLVVSDYERAFQELTCKFEGVTMEHADKYAAARVKYFVERRVDPGRLRKLVQRVFMPLEWLGTELGEMGFVSSAVDSGLQRFEVRMKKQDLREQVVEEYRQAGVILESFDGIRELPVERVVELLKSRRQRRLLLGTVAGGVSGGLAPFSWGTLALADIPVLMSITADVCSRFCWYFGFDPRAHQELPLEILAVALGGGGPEAVEPMLLRQSLSAYVTRRSFVAGAVAQGSFRQLAGKGLVRSLEAQAGAEAVDRVGMLARRRIARNLKHRAVRSQRSPALPVAGALLGAALNAALLYDIVEAAQAVLTDRFLERKYPEWVRHIRSAPGVVDGGDEE